MPRETLQTRARNAIRTFLRHRGGNVAITFGIAAIPVVGAMGAAVDYSLANRAKTTLDAIADAAALSAVNNNAMKLTTNEARKNAEAFFKAQAKNLTLGKYASVKATVKDTLSGRTAVVDYTGKVPTTMMSIVGYDNININGSATAASGLPSYIDFYLLLDNTPSMGVGATPSDVTKMVNNTSDQCAFACHQMDAAPNDYYGLAKKLGVTMRIDVVRQATQKLMDTAKTTAIVPNQFRMAIYTFGKSAEKYGLTKVDSLNANLDAAKKKADDVDLMTVPYQNYKSDTLTDYKVLEDLDKEIALPGNGLTALTPQKYVFFVSDGVADRAVGSPGCSRSTSQGQDPKTSAKYTRCQEPLLASYYCDALKKRGIKIAVLYTTYLALPTNSWYMSWIDPFNDGPYGPSPNSQIAKNMQACASPGFYFEVSPTQGIAEAMTALFEKAVQEAHLTK